MTRPRHFQIGDTTDVRWLCLLFWRLSTVKGEAGQVLTSHSVDDSLTADQLREALLPAIQVDDHGPGDSGQGAPTSTVTTPRSSVASLAGSHAMGTVDSTNFSAAGRRRVSRLLQKEDERLDKLRDETEDQRLHRLLVQGLKEVRPELLATLQQKSPRMYLIGGKAVKVKLRGENNDEVLLYKGTSWVSTAAYFTEQHPPFGGSGRSGSHGPPAASSTTNKPPTPPAPPSASAAPPKAKAPTPAKRASISGTPMGSSPPKAAASNTQRRSSYSSYGAASAQAKAATAKGGPSRLSSFPGRG